MALIEAKNVEKIYHDGKVETPALRGVSFNIEKGEFVAIMGPSGSGKSTMLHIIGFLDEATKGKYLFDGREMKDYSGDEIARVRNKKMGFVFQMFNLLPRTSVLDNVKLPLLYSDVPESEWDDRANEAIKSVGLSHRVLHDPSELSGGERQRAAIARALVNDPQVIFADEPTGNLDSKSGQLIMETIRDLNEKSGRTVVLITHETYTAQHARRVIRLLDGKIESDKLVDKREAREEFRK